MQRTVQCAQTPFVGSSYPIVSRPLSNYTPSFFLVHSSQASSCPIGYFCQLFSAPINLSLLLLHYIVDSVVGELSVGLIGV